LPAEGSPVGKVVFILQLDFELLSGNRGMRASPAAVNKIDQIPGLVVGRTRALGLAQSLSQVCSGTVTGGGEAMAETFTNCSGLY